MATKTKAYLFDGVKSSLLWDEETDAWSYSSNAPEKVGASLYRTIPTLYRGVQIIGNAASKTPFAIYRGETEIDRGDTWENKTEFLPNPNRTFRMISQSLDQHGAAYLLRTRNRAGIGKELRFLAASTIEPILDEERGLIGFRRSIGARQIELKVEEVIYFWLPDGDVEVGPPMAYPLKAAMQAAGVLGNLSAYMEAYFGRGAVRPLIVTAKNMPSKDERERMETWLNKLLGGIKNAFRWKIFNADALNFQQIGDGLDQLQNQSLTADQRQDVSLALGIPQTILFANSANFATSQSDQRNFYDMTVIPRCDFIASVLNEQLLKPLGFRLAFLPNEMDMYQEDESQRASSLQQLAGAGVPLLVAMDLLGYDLTDEQRAELEEEEDEPEPIPPTQPAPMEDEPPMQEEPGPDEEDLAEEKRWKRACLQAHRKGKALPVNWLPESIPFARAEQIKSALEKAQTADDISRAFQNSAAEFWNSTPEPHFSEWTEILAELKRANGLLEQSRE